MAPPSLGGELQFSHGTGDGGRNSQRRSEASPLPPPATPAPAAGAQPAPTVVLPGLRRTCLRRQPRCSSPSRHCSRRPGPEAALIAAPGTHRGVGVGAPRPETRRQGGAWGRSSGKRGTAAGSSGTKLQGDGAWEAHTPRKVWSRPRRVPSAPAPAASGLPGPRSWFISEVSRATQEEQRGRTATRGGSCNSRGSSASHRVAFCAARKPPPRPCPQQAQSRAGDRLAGSEERRRAPDRAPGLPRSAAAWHLAPWPRSEQPGPRQLPPSRGVSAARCPGSTSPPTRSEGPGWHPEDPGGA